eukprot:TRINITY_DN5210_c0_g1_i1.p1 TRINITY_DN5210_c0_g1~~TRINITY_DN5210_c0_g1_i1.p1  ORF type:complete len:194 (-),score=20.37 TRINITY_DN5210_c0_g1_i1:77-658(-)
MFLAFRLLAGTKRLRVFVQTISHLLPAFACFGLIQLSVFYFYSILGMEVFYNRSANPIVPTYSIINFNTFPNSMVALYCLMTVNNWNSFMDGAVITTGSKWTRLYYMSFYLVTVVIILNVIVAFIIETFVEQTKLRSDLKSSDKFRGTVLDDEIRGRIEKATARNPNRRNWQVRTLRDPNAVFEGLYRSGGVN